VNNVSTANHILRALVLCGANWEFSQRRTPSAHLLSFKGACGCCEKPRLFFGLGFASYSLSCVKILLTDKSYANSGTGFEEDENIMQSRRRMGSRDFVISSDTTSGTNSQRTVFEQQSGRGWCVVLTSPPVADLTPGQLSASTRRPMTWFSVTQAPPGFPETRVLYKWDSKHLIYKPAGCYKGGVGHWEAIDCDEAYR
jgi:hypothetical protein